MTCVKDFDEIDHGGVVGVFIGVIFDKRAHFFDIGAFFVSLSIIGVRYYLIKTGFDIFFESKQVLAMPFLFLILSFNFLSYKRSMTVVDLSLDSCECFLDKKTYKKHDNKPN